MCRHLAYLGPPVTLASLVLEPEHSLYKQSWAPADMRGGGSVNADGFGLAWYPTDPPAPAPQATSAATAPTSATAGAGLVPVRFRRGVPIWADESLPGLAGSVRSGAVLAAVRNGTVGMPLGEPGVAPFVRDQWIFSHNGMITGWPASIAKLAETLPVTELLTLDAPTDSALLWALILDRLYSGSSAPEAVASVVSEVAAAAPDSRLNILLTDGKQLVATTWTHSLWVRKTADSVAVSSEPWTAVGWDEVTDQSLLVATKDTVAITALTQPDDSPAAPPEQHPMEGR